jgi:hypothetical protein
MKLRFSIRDLFWFTLLCAVLVAWWISYQSLKARTRFQVETVESGTKQPVLIRDTVTGEVLVKDGNVWKIGK